MVISYKLYGKFKLLYEKEVMTSRVEEVLPVASDDYRASGYCRDSYNVDLALRV